MGKINERGGPAVLLVGPYDPHCGEYTFLAPPLGVWRLAGLLGEFGHSAEVFDPNCCEGPPERALERTLASRRWDVIGFSTTGMTLRYDLALAHLARRRAPRALLLAGGMEASFKPELMFELGPFDLVILGEGERPLLQIARRLAEGAELKGIAGTAFPDGGGGAVRLAQPALTRDELVRSSFATPYAKMPYQAYWNRLEEAYRVGDMPYKAHREARLAEIRSVRVMTLNYCPMGCSFCSSTNFLNDAQGSVARVARLDASECLEMVGRVVAAQPRVRTVIFQDDIFVFTSDDRILELCEGIVLAKARGDLPESLQFISTNRIDAMDRQRLAAMKRAGFRVMGFGIESFSLPILKEFNKARIHSYIEPGLSEALRQGVTPFLDMILTSPRCRLEDLADNLLQAYQWTSRGCEVGMYPYVIPFSGAAMADDPSLKHQTVHRLVRIAGTSITWNEPIKILPENTAVREAIVAIEATFNDCLGLLHQVAHLPSRVRSLLWIACAAPTLSSMGVEVGGLEGALADLMERLPRLDAEVLRALTIRLGDERLLKSA